MWGDMTADDMTEFVGFIVWCFANIGAEFTNWLLELLIQIGMGFDV